MGLPSAMSLKRVGESSLRLQSHSSLENFATIPSHLIISIGGGGGTNAIKQPPCHHHQQQQKSSRLTGGSTCEFPGHYLGSDVDAPVHPDNPAVLRGPALPWRGNNRAGVLAGEVDSTVNGGSRVTCGSNWFKRGVGVRHNKNKQTGRSPESLASCPLLPPTSCLFLLYILYSLSHWSTWREWSFPCSRPWEV